MIGNYVADGMGDLGLEPMASASLQRPRGPLTSKEKAYYARLERQLWDRIAAEARSPMRFNQGIDGQLRLTRLAKAVEGIWEIHELYARYGGTQTAL